MKAALNRWLDAVRTGFWFMPLLMLASSAVLALLLLHVDRRVDPGLETGLRWAYSGGPEGARSLLSTIAGSMITAASVTFSLASVALSIASQQYGSRVLRNFMRDRITQVLLGTFLSTFVYSVLVVRTIRGSDFSGGFVPAISVTVAMALSLTSLVLLVYFIHHVSTSIQASHIIRVVAQGLEEELPRLYPAGAGEPADDPVAAELQRAKGVCTLSLDRRGYLQTVDLTRLMDNMCRLDTVGRLLVKPGDHLLAGAPAVEVMGAAGLTEEARKAILDCFFLDRERTPAQDIRFLFQQLTDVIVRALSPGINDPFTAINGIDELAAALQQMLRTGPVREQRHDASGTLRLIAPRPKVREILQETVGHIAVFAASDPFVVASLRRVLQTVRIELHDTNDLAFLDHLAADLDRREQAAG